MKLKVIVPLSLLAFFSMSSCSCSSNQNNSGGVPSGISVSLPSEMSEPEITGAFSILDSNNQVVSPSGSVYTLSSGGSYTATGFLEEGQIIVSAGDNDNVELVLEGAKITNSTDSPIMALTGNKLEVKAKSGYSNLIKDLRAEKTIDLESVGEGAIHSKIDLKFTGQGTLISKSSYSSGIHCTKDVEIQNLILEANGVHNAIKGKDSITVTSGTITLFSSKGQGLKTVNSDKSSSGNQRGTITINGGSVGINTCYDAIDASYDVKIAQADSSVSTTVGAYTAKNSSYSANYDGSSSAKGLKANNLIDISAGDIVISAGDDAIHANYGTTLGNGTTGLGNIVIAGGSIGIASGDDGIHADNTVTISGGTIQISNATEGIESNHLNISGGQTYIYGSDDGVNASKKINETPSIEISGGFLDISVSGNDVDGIDSNGSYTQSGGLVISRGSTGSQVGLSTALDCDGEASISGGTFIAFNGVEKAPSRGSSVLYAGTFSEGSSEGQVPPGGGSGHHPRATLNASYSSGTYKLSGGDMDITFANNYDYSTFCVYSSLLKKGTSYTLSKDDSTLLSWSQSSDSQVIS